MAAKVRVQTIAINLDDSSYAIGRLESWATDPSVYDGWLEETDGPFDELVINGASEAWARYLVLRRYMGTLLAEIDKTNGKLTSLNHLTVAGAMHRLASVAEEMEMTLLQHLQEEH